MKYCCDEFAEQAGALRAMAGGGFMYPREAKPNAQFEPSIDGATWNINGCCGGGCSVVQDMTYCPYCGSKLESPLKENYENKTKS